MGKAVHAGVELFNTTLKDGGSPNSESVVSRFETDFLNDLEDYMVDDAYTKYLNKTKAKSPMDEEAHREKLINDHLSMGTSLLNQFMARTDHGSEFRFIEEYLEHTIEVAGEQLLFRYVPDLVDKHNGKVRLRDYKTKATETKKLAEFQLSAYAYLLKDQFGIEVDEIDQLSFIKSIKKPRIQVLPYDINRLEEDIAIFLDELEMFVRGTKAGIFPRNTDHIFCGGCDYRQQCFNPLHTAQQAGINAQSTTPNDTEKQEV
jgi:CRISPR/Cas system-associated exonuclease Cas4 (RecB family)